MEHVISKGDKFFDHMFEHFGRSENFFFVQIGACDGKSFDPIYKHAMEYGWSGLAVEPLPHLFNELRSNYSGLPGVRFAQKAISDKPGPGKMYFIDDNSDELPDWVKGIGTLKPEKNALGTDFWESAEGKKLIAEGIDPEHFKSKIQETEVECVTLDMLFEENQVSRLDLLQIDAEGMDFAILMQLSFEKYRPVLINFEHINLSEQEKKNAAHYLVTNNYLVVSWNYTDYLAIDRNKTNFWFRFSHGLKSR